MTLTSDLPVEKGKRKEGFNENEGCEKGSFSCYSVRGLITEIFGACAILQKI